MHYYGETDLITKLLNIAIVVVLVLGIISGIGYGMNEMKLSDEASEAMMKSIELRADRYSSIYADEIKELDEKATEKKWTLECTISMLLVWIVSAIIALLLFCKRHQIEMIDKVTMILDKNVPKTE